MRAQSLVPALALIGLVAAPAAFAAPDNAMSGKINNGGTEAASPPPRLNHGLPPDSVGEATGARVPELPPASPGAQGHGDVGAFGVSQQAAQAAATPQGGPPGASPQTMPERLSAANKADDQRSWIQRELNLSVQQKGAIATELGSAGEKTTGSGHAGGESAVTVGTVLPLSVTLRELPASLTTRMPELAGLQYVKLVDRILIVDPSERVVLADVSL